MPYVSLKWIWVAVTRTMNMNDVLIYNGKSQEFNETIMNKFFELKIKDYQIQDTKAKRTLHSKNYVNPEWFEQFLTSPCPKCNNTYNMHHDKYRFYADITANRLDNSLCHSLDNIEPCCSKCNSDLSDKGDKDKQPLESSKTNQVKQKQNTRTTNTENKTKVTPNSNKNKSKASTRNPRLSVRNEEEEEAQRDITKPISFV